MVSAASAASFIFLSLRVNIWLSIAVSIKLIRLASCPAGFSAIAYLPIAPPFLRVYVYSWLKVAGYTYYWYMMEIEPDTRAL